jgi:oxalate decarboxylase/phosphoglucose isomerase-like protein (cupin superfamily)
MTPIVYPLFSSPVYCIPDTGLRLSENELARLEEYPSINDECGLSRNVNILAEPNMEAVREVCEHHLDQYVKNVFGCANNFYITTSWLSRNKPGADHYAHSHPNSVISGCLYLKAGSGNKLNFHGHNHFNKQFPLTWDIKTFNIYNSDDWWIPVDTGTIVLWPSNITHSASPNTLDETRIALCFNSFVRGQFGGGGSYAGELEIK